MSTDHPAFWTRVLGDYLFVSTIVTVACGCAIYWLEKHKNNQKVGEAKAKGGTIALVLTLISGITTLAVIPFKKSDEFKKESQLETMAKGILRIEGKSLVPPTGLTRQELIDWYVNQAGGVLNRNDSTFSTLSNLAVITNALIRIISLLETNHSNTSGTGLDAALSSVLARLTQSDRRLSDATGLMNDLTNDLARLHIALTNRIPIERAILSRCEDDLRRFHEWFDYWSVYLEQMPTNPPARQAMADMHNRLNSLLPLHPPNTFTNPPSTTTNRPATPGPLSVSSAPPP